MTNSIITEQKIDVNENDFILKELDNLRGMYRSYAEETRASEKYSLTIVAGIWAWCISDMEKHPEITLLLSWIPTFVSLLFGLRSYGFFRYMNCIREYILKLENSTDLPEIIGWERFPKGTGFKIYVSTSFGFWIILQTITSILPFIFLHLLKE
jgi:hypothetical protein